MSRSAFVVAAIALMVTMVGGCGVPISGSPVAAMPGPTESAGPSPGSTVPSTPSRPPELRLDGKNVCSLVSSSQFPEFQIIKPGKLETEPLFKSPDCFYVAAVGSFDIVLVMTEGIEAWRGGKRAGKDTDIPPINGYPSIKIQRPDLDLHSCSIAVDVARGQYVLTQVIIDSDKLSTVPELCVYARRWTELVMNSLVAQR